MRIQSELCHINSTVFVVRVTAWEAETELGSALGQGPNAEAAEDSGIARLIDRLAKLREVNTNNKVDKRSPNGVIGEHRKKFPQQIAVGSKEPKQQITNQPNKNLDSNEKENENLLKVPLDWSNELSAIDTEIARLGWDKSKENQFLEKKLGVRGRHQITKYSDILSLLEDLKSTNNSALDLNQHDNNIRGKLIKDSNKYLQALKWNPEEGRIFLSQHMNVSSRQNLSNENLDKFNKLLEKELSKIKPNGD